MSIKGLEQAVENLSRISKTAVPGATAMAINRVASSAISQSASQVARETKVRRKLVKERARLKRATVKNPQARIKVNRGDLPVIKLGNARVVLSRRRRRKKGQRSSLKGGGSVLVVGNRRIAKWHLNRSWFGITIDHDLACFRSLIGILPVTPGINSFHHSLHCRV